ncbi:MAG: hypothetical protein ABI433_07205 [Burkholderiaceae bacterium]
MNEMDGYAGYDIDADTVGFAMPPLVSTTDINEWAKMQPYTSAPAGREQAPWWQNAVSYGLTKAIDNTFPNQNNGVRGNTQPGSFAGQNGRSYNQVGGVNAAPTLAGISNSISRMNPLVLVALAVGAYIVLRR